MAQELWSLARREEGAYPLRSVTDLVVAPLALIILKTVMKISRKGAKHAKKKGWKSFK